ncbi:MAG: hypothetical protein AAF797_11560 [Planctomycetota bacterium]
MTIHPIEGLAAQATQPAEPADELARLRAENAELRRELSALRAELAELRKGQAVLAKEAEKLTEEKQQLAEQKEQLAEEKQELQELAGVTTDGRIADEAAARIKSAYDADADRTAYWIEFEEVEDTDRTRDPHFLAVRVEHAGQTPTADDTPTARISVFAQFSGTTYRSQLPMKLVIDGQPDPSPGIPVAHYERNLRTINARGDRKDHSDERLDFDLPPDVFDRLQSARTVTLTVGRIRLHLGRDQVAVFRALGKRVEPTTP